MLSTIGLLIQCFEYAYYYDKSQAIAILFDYTFNQLYLGLPKIQHTSQPNIPTNVPKLCTIKPPYL